MSKTRPISDLQCYTELLKELEEGERSAREQGWLSADEVEEAVGLKAQKEMKEQPKGQM